MQALIDSNQYARALRLHELVVAAAPNDPIVNRRYAILLKDNGRLDEALNLLLQWAEKPGIDLDNQLAILNNLALTLNGLGRRSDACATFERAAALSTEALDVRENHAVMLFDHGDWQGAKALFATVVARDKSRERSRYYLGEIGRYEAGFPLNK